MVTDIDTRFLEGLAGGPLEVHRHDISSDPVPSSSFDLVHARAVLEHVPGRREVIPKLVSALRPGGTLVLEDVVVGVPRRRRGSVRSALAMPRQAWAARWTLWPLASGPSARIPCSAWKLPALLAGAGLDQIAADITFSLVRGGSKAAQFYGLSIAELGDRLIAAGLLSQQDVDTLEEFCQQPESRWFSIGIVSAIGRRAG